MSFDVIVTLRLTKSPRKEDIGRKKGISLFFYIKKQVDQWGVHPQIVF